MLLNRARALALSLSLSLSLPLSLSLSLSLSLLVWSEIPLKHTVDALAGSLAIPITMLSHLHADVI